MTFMELMKLFPTEDKVVEYYINVRYPNGVHCNHCGSTKVYQENNRKKVFSCNDCRSTFSPFTGTIFEHSSTDLRKWMYAIHLFLNGKKGISGLQLQREIGVTYKTAWRMLQQIRLAMRNGEQQEFIETIVEIDETYIGGKPRKTNGKDNDDDMSNNNTNKRGRGTSKTPVIGVVDRINKKIIARVAMPNSVGQKLTGIQLLRVLSEVSKQENNNVVITDEVRAYNILDKRNFVRFKIDHTKMFSDGDIYTNNIESFWSVLKRGIYGIYHHIGQTYAAVRGRILLQIQ